MKKKILDEILKAESVWKGKPCGIPAQYLFLIGVGSVKEILTSIEALWVNDKIELNIQDKKSSFNKFRYSKIDEAEKKVLSLVFFNSRENMIHHIFVSNV